MSDFNLLRHVTGGGEFVYVIVCVKYICLTLCRNLLFYALVFIYFWDVTTTLCVPIKFLGRQTKTMENDT